jgi:hypothetical protein
MPLPKIAVPTYELEVPSLKKNIKYRPFLVKEEKILIIAMESEDTKQIAEAVKTVISNCIITKGIKVEQLSSFDIENNVIEFRKNNKLPLQGIASSNIRRQLLLLREIFILEKVKNSYRINENSKLK